MKEGAIVHFMLRVPLMVEGTGRPLNTVEAHNEVVARTGRVSVTKIGKAGTAERVRLLKNQIEAGQRMHLILVSKRGQRFLGFQSRVAAVHLGEPTADMLDVAPRYYAETGLKGGLWFTVDEPFTTCDLSQFRLLTNKRPLLAVVGETRTTSMLVERVTS